MTEVITHLATDFAIYSVMGMVAAYYYYHYRKREFLGGFWGAAIIGTVGAVLITMITGINVWFLKWVTWLMQPKYNDTLLFRVNLITAFLGAFLFVRIMNKINHDRERKS